jgi:hypothetical protein
MSLQWFMFEQKSRFHAKGFDLSKIHRLPIASVIALFNFCLKTSWSKIKLILASKLKCVNVSWINWNVNFKFKKTATLYPGGIRSHDP